MPDQDHFGDGRVGKAGFDVVNGNANVPCIVRKTPLDQAFDDVGDWPVTRIRSVNMTE